MDQQQQQQHVAAGEASSYQRSRDQQALAEALDRDIREFDAYVRACSAGNTRDLRRHHAADQRPRRAASGRPASRGGGARAGSTTATAAATEGQGQHQQPGQGPGGLGEQQGQGHAVEAAMAALDLDLIRL